MSRIREATKEDVLDLLVLFKQFSKESGYKYKLDMVTLKENLELAVEAPNFLLSVLEVDGEIVGSLVGAVTTPLFSKDKTATELAWFVEESHRGSSGSLRLIKNYENWAKDKGCKFVTMVDIDSLNNLEQVYKRVGYTLTEKTYVKELK